MKKPSRPTRTPPRAAVLTAQQLAAVTGGTGGTIIVENALPTDPAGGTR